MENEPKTTRKPLKTSLPKPQASSTGTTKQRTFKEFRELAEASKQISTQKNDERLEELLVIAYNSTKHQSFREWLGTISKLMNQEH